MGPDPENRRGDEDFGSPGKTVSSGLQVPGQLGHCRKVQDQDICGELPVLFFLQNFLKLHQERWEILRMIVWPFGR